MGSTISSCEFHEELKGLHDKALDEWFSKNIEPKLRIEAKRGNKFIIIRYDSIDKDKLKETCKKRGVKHYVKHELTNGEPRKYYKLYW